MKKKTQVIVEHTGNEDATYQDFCSALTVSDECRYGVFEIHYQVQDGDRSKLGLFSWCPPSTSVKEKFLLAGTMGAVKFSFDGIQFEVEAGNVQTLDYELVLEKCQRREQ